MKNNKRENDDLMKALILNMNEGLETNLRFQKHQLDQQRMELVSLAKEIGEMKTNSKSLSTSHQHTFAGPGDGAVESEESSDSDQERVTRSEDEISDGDYSHSTSHPVISTRSKKSNKKDSTQDGRILEALTKLWNSRSACLSEDSLFINSAPTEFEPKSPFLNYQWFVALENSLKEHSELPFRKKLVLLKRLVVKNADV